MRSRYRYVGRCTGPDVLALRETLLPMRWRSLYEHCKDARAFLLKSGAIDSKTTNAQIEVSPGLSFHKGTYRGKQCYVIVWRAIEFVWVRIG